MSPDAETNLLRFLHTLDGGLKSVADDQKAIWLSLRSTRDFFKATDACIALLPPGNLVAELLFVIPREGAWNLDLLTAFLQRQKPAIPPDTLLAPLNRRNRLWAVLGLRFQEGEFDRNGYGKALYRIAKAVSESIHHIDWERIVEVRSRIDHKIMEQLRPKDLFYQILHGLRSLIRYDHSSGLLICDERGDALELVAEQVAWLKGKSRRIGLRLPLSRTLRELMHDGTVYGFDREGDQWRGWQGQEAAPLAELLDYNRPTSDPDSVPREAALLCAPLGTGDGLLGVLRVAARHPHTFGAYEAELLQRFMPLAGIAIQNSRRTEILETKMLEAEKKHAIANLARGVSHDVNNALGSVLPLVQQMLADLKSGHIETHLLAEDLQQIEQSLQTCRRIFGGMLAMARGSGQKIGEGSVNRAIESTLSILKDSFRRRAIRLNLDLSVILPVVKGRQGDLEQLFLNLMTNARDAMPTGGILSIRTGQLNGGVEVTIQDTGCGIPPELLSRIHEPFFTTKHSGRGLGLSICRSIVWDMRGDLKIDSREGEGTQVRVLLPLSKEREPGAKA